MKRLLLPVAALLVSALFFIGFQCSSTELTSAKLYIQQKNLDKALDALKKEVEKNPKSDEGYYLMGYLYGEKEDYKNLMSNYDKSLSISNKFEKDIVNSKKYHWASLFNKGVGFYQKAAQTKAEDSATIYFDKSIYNFNNAILLQPDSADTYKNLAFVYISQAKYDDAIPQLEKLVSLKKSPEGIRFLGEIYYNKGQMLRNEYEKKKIAADSVKAQDYFLKAISTLEEGKKLYPDDTEILLFLSNSYIAANKIAVAIDAFKTGVEKDPKNKFYRYNYGVLLLGANDFELAVEQFKAAIEIDGEYSNAIYNLAVTYVKWGAKIAKDAEEKGKEDPEAKAKYSLALPYLEAYVQKKSNEAPVWELLGKVYSVLSKTKEAEDAFKKADELRK
jgi:tetratricopeptide (TPR) repeat protein